MQLPWAPEIPVRYVTVDGDTRIRYIVEGSGPALVLLHTLRTQLDMFQKVIPELAHRFTVYALDYPGHGYSDAPDADYTAEFFVAAVAGVLDRLSIADATVVGESIGGTIALVLAARHHPRVRRVVADNPYDYDRGRGLRRSSLLAQLVFAAYEIPVLGAKFWQVRPPYAVVKRIFDGGVYRKKSFPAGLERELYTVGAEPTHARAFRRLVEHWPSWEQVRTEYGHIALPVLLLYGDHDWSHEDEREADRRAIPGAHMQVVEHAGHFLALDAPEALVRAVVGFAAGQAA